MYTDFYDLIGKPFELTPDPRYVYLSVHHKEALAHLKYGVDERKGFIQLTGEVGTGKTTMLDVLISELDASTAVAKLSHTTIDEVDLLRMIARGFDVDGTSEAGSKADLLELLRDRLTAWSKEGRNAVLVVDEAQNLSLPVLEEIRLLSNLKANGRLGLQIILAGQPELREKLENPELRQLRQRIGIRYHLTPLSSTETAEYVAHRMAVAGAERGIFRDGAVEAVYEYSQGVPRLVNMICDRALLAGYAESRPAISRELVAKAIAGLEGTPFVLRPRREEPDEAGAEDVREPEASRPARVRWAAPLLAGAVVVAVALSAVFYFEDRERGALPADERAVAASGAVTDTLPEAGEPSVVCDEDESADASPRAVSGTLPEADEQPAVYGQETETPPDEGQTYMSAGEHGDTPHAEATPVERVDGGEETVTHPSVEAADAGEQIVGHSSEVGQAVAVPETAFLVVIASSSERGAAEGKASELTASGVEATVWTVDLGDRGIWHRIVLSSGYDSLSSASRAAEALQSMGYEDAWVLRR